MGNWDLIDKDTPRELHTKVSVILPTQPSSTQRCLFQRGWYDGTEMELVFSDEFEEEGRSFYPGDDPYWEAHDLHYWGTNNLEW